MVTSDAALASATITSATTARRSVWFLEHTPVRRRSNRAICYKNGKINAHLMNKYKVVNKT
jgi:hypothetical protein